MSFTLDTKTGDGDTATTLTEDQDSNLVAAAKKAEDDSNRASGNTNGTVVNPPKGKSREEAKTAYLDYLSQFHSDKSNWKFNKTKQTDLLKNLFNIYRVPTEYNEALLAYIDGLQGLGAKQRLWSQASQLIADLKNSVVSDLPKDAKDTDMSTPEARRTAYIDAEEREVKRLQALAQPDAKAEEEIHETARRRRAQDERATEILLLRSLTSELGLPSNEPSTNHSQNKQLPTPGSLSKSDSALSARAKKRKRKARTADSDSDSSSSSDSDSDSNSGKKTSAKGKAKGKKSILETAESSSDTSSSDSSSSDSDSDSSDTGSDSDASSSDSSSSEEDSDASSSSSEEEQQPKKKLKGTKQKATKKTDEDVPFDKDFLDSAFGQQKKKSKR